MANTEGSMEALNQNILFDIIEPGEHSLGRTKNFCVWVILALVTLAQAFESTCICVTLPSIAAELDASVAQSLSFAVLFLLTSTTAQPGFKELAYLAGRRVPFVYALLVFIAGTVVCGLAKSSSTLVIGRAVQGIGAGGTQPLVALILTDLYDIRDRAKWTSLLNIVWAIGTILGPLIGGLFAMNERLTWRWMFWINIPVLAVPLVGGICLLGYDWDRRKTVPRWPLWKRYDWCGPIIFTCAVFCIILPLIYGGHTLRWSQPELIISLVAGILLLALLAHHEICRAVKPVFRPSLFNNRASIIGFINTTIHGLLMWMVLFYMSIYYLGVKAVTPVEAGLWALPATLTVVPIALAAGLITAKAGHYLAFLGVGWVASIAVFGSLLLLKEDTSNHGLIAISLAAGISFGTLVPALSTSLQASVDRQDSGNAYCMNLQLRPAGQCLGLTLGLTIFSNRLEQELVNSGFPEGVSHGLMNTMRHSLRTGHAYTDNLIVDAILKALGAVWIAGTVLAGVAGLLTLVAGHRALPKDRCHLRRDESQLALVDGEIKDDSSPDGERVQSPRNSLLQEGMELQEIRLVV